MKMTSSKALLAVVATAIGLSAAAPAMAQTQTPAPDAPMAQPDQPARPDQGGPRRGPGGDLLDFGRGGEAIEIALVRLSHRIDLTAEQQTLFDALKTSALAAATDFETAVEGLRPVPPTEGAQPTMPSMAERLDNRIAMEKAHLAALEAVQPEFTAFFDSLTDAQKADLMPQRGGEGGWGPRGGQPGGHKGPHGVGPEGDGPRG